MTDAFQLSGLFRDERSLQQATGAGDIGLFAPLPDSAVGSVAVIGPHGSDDAGTTPGTAFAVMSQAIVVSNEAVEIAGSPAGSGTVAAPGSINGAPIASAAESDVRSPEAAPAEPAVVGSGTPFQAEAPVFYSFAADVGAGPAATVAPSSDTVEREPLHDSVETVRAGADHLAAALDRLVERIEGERAPETIAAVQDAAAALSATAGAVLDGIGTRIDHRIEAAEVRAEQVVTDVGAISSDLLASAHDTINQTAARAGELVGAVVSTAHAAVGDVAGRVADAAGGVAAAAVDTLDIDALGGVDPPAGIATLTALLDDAVQFEVHDPQDDTLVFATVAEALPDLDAPVEALGDTIEAAPAVLTDATEGLLGATDHVGGLLGGLDHNDDGIFGHG